MDAIDGASLSNGDVAIVMTTAYSYVYHLDASSTELESSPDYIAPDTNPGTKMWKKKDYYMRLGSLQAPTATTSTALHATTAAAGLLRKLNGSSSQFLNGDGKWVKPKGTTTFLANTSEDTTPRLAGDLVTNGKYLTFTTGGSSDHSAWGFIKKGGTTFAVPFGHVCRMTTLGRWKMINANTSANMQGQLSISLSSLTGTGGAASGDFLLWGWVRDASYSTKIGRKLYASTVDGHPKATRVTGAGKVDRYIGCMTSSTNIFKFNPSDNYVTLSS